MAKKQTHALVSYNPKLRKTIYKMLHHTTKLPIYVGQTCNDANRAAKYRAAVKEELTKQGQANLVIAYLKELLDLGLPVNLVPMDAFPDGVPLYRADGFEALMIHKLKTASACGKGGKNTSCGNNLAKHVKRFKEYDAELAPVYVWSAADLAMRDNVPKEVVAAEANLAALSDLQELCKESGVPANKNVDEQVDNALVVWWNRQ